MSSTLFTIVIALLGRDTRTVRRGPWFRISGGAYSFVTFLFDELLELTAPAHLPS
jgi:hypothetical protein